MAVVARSTNKRKVTTENLAQATLLTELGLHRGEVARFKRISENSNWISGRIHAVEKDGSVTLHDEDGAARSLRPERIEIQRPNRRGKLQWQNLAEVLAGSQQLTLFAPVRGK